MPLDAKSSICTKPQTTTEISKLTILQFGQELLSTFGTQIGEIALIPATGGLFQVELVRRVLLAQCHKADEIDPPAIYLHRL